MPQQKLALTPNVPIQIALKYPEGKIVEGRFGDQVYFSLAEPPDSCLYLDMGIAQAINQLGLRRGQLFWACKRWSGKKSDSPMWDFWPVARDEMKPVPSPAAQATGIADTELEQQLRASLAEIERKKKAETVAPAPAPTAPTPSRQLAQPPSNNGNGTSNGHNAPPDNGGSSGNSGNGAPKPYLVSGVPTKIPMNVALREIVEFTTAELKTSGLHLEGGPIQDLISTFVIGGMREGWIGVWERGAK